MKSSKTVRHKPASEGQSESLFNAGDFLEDIGELRAAFQCFRAAAEGNHGLGQCRLGDMYSAGRGVRKDLKKAAFWYKKAFNDRGSSTAAINLGIDLKNSGNIKGAIRWFEKARALGDGYAYMQLARIYAERKTGRKKAESLLKEVLASDSENVTELDKEDAQQLLGNLLGN